MKKLLKSQRGAIDIILIMVIFVAAAVLGGYVYYQQRQAQNTYDAAGKGTNVTKRPIVKKSAKIITSGTSTPSTSTNTNSQLPAQVLAAAIAYCKGTQHLDTYINGTEGPNSVAITYSASNKNFATTNGACVESGASGNGGGEQFFFDHLTSGWTVIYVGQEEPACDGVKNLAQYRIPTDTMTCYNPTTQQSQAIR